MSAIQTFREGVLKRGIKLIMPHEKNHPSNRKYLIIRLFQCVIWFGAVFLLNSFASKIFAAFASTAESQLFPVFFVTSLICFLSFLAFYLSLKTPFPSFVVAIIFGLLSRSLLLPVAQNYFLVTVIVNFGAILILFQGGLEIRLDNFRKLFWKIFLLSFPGVLLTGFLLSNGVVLVGNITGIIIPITVAILLGAALASTDPAAVIPLLQVLRFKNKDTKDIIVSESALNDVVGALLTLVFVSFILGGNTLYGIFHGYVSLFSLTSIVTLSKQILFGVVAGSMGYIALQLLAYHKKEDHNEYGPDAAFFIFAPIVAFALAIVMGGNGYMAVFITGLFFYGTKYLKDTEHFFNYTLDGFIKPMIFLLLGALIDAKQLFHYAIIGIPLALIFIFIIRPLVVFIIIGPFAFIGKNRISLSQLLFISWVRETGVIPAVLLITIASLPLSNIESLVPVGMWVILITLIIQPPFTPWLAKYLGLVEDSSNTKLGD